MYSRDPMVIISEVEKNYILKGTGVPQYYLGDVEYLDEQLNKQCICMALSAHMYIKNVTTKLEDMLRKNTPFTKHRSPMNELYHPETDSTLLLNAEMASIIPCLVVQIGSSH
jgi:hypothetical protein